MDDSEKTLKYLIQVERLAEEILADKNAIVYLDKRRNENREAARALKKIPNNQRKNWLVVGTSFVKCSIDNSTALIEDDQKQIDAEINKLRSELKIKVNKLRDLEYQPPVPGLLLAPLSKEEHDAFKGKLY